MDIRALEFTQHTFTCYLELLEGYELTQYAITPQLPPDSLTPQAVLIRAARKVAVMPFGGDLVSGQRIGPPTW